MPRPPKMSASLAIGGTAIALAVAGCAGGAATQDPSVTGSGTDGSSRAEPIRVAVVSPHSGPYAEMAAQQRAGLQYAADEANADGGVEGREVVLFVADSLGTNEGALAAAEKLVRNDDARFIVGPVSSAVSLALMQRLEHWDAVQFGVQSQSNALTGAECKPRFFRTIFSDHIQVQGLGAWLSQQDVDDWDLISADYAFGHDSAAGLEKLASTEGWDIGANLFSPLGTTDFGSYITQMDGGGGLQVSLSGGDAVNFLSQALEFGLLDRYEYVVGNAAFVTASLNGVNDADLIGHWGTTNWVSSVDNDETTAFVEGYIEANGEAPADMAGAGYLAMQTLFAGIAEADSVEPAAVAAALEGLTFSSIKGEVTMRAEDHQLAAPMYIGQVEKTEHGYDLVVRDTIPISKTMPEADPACDLGPR